MFQAGCGDGELQGLAGEKEMRKPVNQAGREAVPAAHPVDDMGDLVGSAQQKLLTIVRHADQPLWEALLDSRNVIAMAFILG